MNWPPMRLHMASDDALEHGIGAHGRIMPEPHWPKLLKQPPMDGEQPIAPLPTNVCPFMPPMEEGKQAPGLAPGEKWANGP
eukprot:3792104-Pleurochrysis_carterae.AAC.3